MKQTLFSLLCLMVLTLASCSKEPTLQKYFVDNSDKKNFVTLDIAPNFVNTDSVKLSQEEKTALRSLQKLNVLAFKADGKNQSQLKQEQEKVKTLLKDEKYEELLHVGSNDQGASIHTVGEGDNIEEFVIYAHQNERGLAVVRVLGNDMNPNNIMTLVGLLQKGNLNMEQLKPLQELMAPQSQLPKK